METPAKFQVIGSAWASLHPTPKGVIQFIGGAFFGTLPIIFAPQVGLSSMNALPYAPYRYLLRGLFQAGYSVILWPYRLTFNHWPVTQRLLTAQQELPLAIMRAAQKWGYTFEIYENPYNYCWLGHSLGCEYIVLTRFLSLSKSASGQPEPAPQRLSLNHQPAVLMAPCFRPPALFKTYKQPTQDRSRRLLIETGQDIAHALISFSQDSTAGNLAHRLGDVHWTYQHLPKRENSGLVLHQEIDGSHYRPLGYGADDPELLEIVLYCVERLAMSQREQAVKKPACLFAPPKSAVVQKTD